jgi:hypothetical protein
VCIVPQRNGAVTKSYLPARRCDGIYVRTRVRRTGESITCALGGRIHASRIHGRSSPFKNSALGWC